ncbi:MAG: substrate-binding domain-containing protein [candidate division Zixibacteria bacterium]|nr:substrate-binding domain-containing protein [candidate division Zixibacteria bacterium]
MRRRECLTWRSLVPAFVALVIAIPAGASDTVRTGGTGASLGLAKALGAAFMAANPDVMVDDVPSLGSSGGIKAASQGAIDIAFSSRPLKSEEKPSGLVDAKWVITPFVLVKDDDSVAHDITIPEIERIYTGAVTSWPNGERIRLVLRPAAESDTRIAKEISPAMHRAIDSLHAIEGILIAVTDQDCLSTVGKVPGAVGFSTLAQVITEKRPVQVFSIGGVKPSVTALIHGDYHYAKPLYMIWKPNPANTGREVWRPRRRSVPAP